MQKVSNKQILHAEQARGQGPIWFAVGGLLVAVFGYSMSEEVIGDMVALHGAVIAVLALLYWFFRPRHGL
jgi:hypothetical protein